MKLLKSSRILIAPSRMESLPTNIKEAFYLKIPVVATNVGGIPELVSHNKTGILIPPENPNALSNAVNNLLEDSELIKKITSNAYEFVINEMSWKKILPIYIQFYENLLNS